MSTINYGKLLFVVGAILFTTNCDRASKDTKEVDGLKYVESIDENRGNKYDLNKEGTSVISKSDSIVSYESKGIQLTLRQIKRINAYFISGFDQFEIDPYYNQLNNVKELRIRKTENNHGFEVPEITKYDYIYNYRINGLLNSMDGEFKVYKNNDDLDYYTPFNGYMYEIPWVNIKANLYKMKKNDNTLIKVKFNAKNQLELLQKIYSDNSVTSIRFRYDLLGRISHIHNPPKFTGFEYSDDGILVIDTFYNKHGGDSYLTYKGYVFKDKYTLEGVSAKGFKAEHNLNKNLLNFPTYNPNNTSIRIKEFIYFDQFHEVVKIEERNLISGEISVQQVDISYDYKNNWISKRWSDEHTIMNVSRDIEYFE